MGQPVGLVALITGAGSGIGRATALALAGAGAQVALTGRTRERLEETAAQVAALPGVGHDMVWTAPCDVTAADEVQRLVADVQARYGRLDILVNNAGLNLPDRALSVLSVQDWQRLIAANLDSAFYCVHAALPIMRAQGRGLMIHISSQAARRPSTLAGAGYTAAKAGVAWLSAVINAEERRHGIRSSVIMLGDTDTPLIDQRPLPPAEDTRARYLQPEDVAACVLLIASLPERATIEELALVPTRLT
jgi:NAD(P)-dependent dehydrogenase (short-subunit alcohol dehydrogenase family)